MRKRLPNLPEIAGAFAFLVTLLLLILMVGVR
jgi:hypothetical protein